MAQVQIYAGLLTEGSTDIRFLEPIVQNTLTSVAIECSGQIDIGDIFVIQKDKGSDFIHQVLAAAKKGMDEFSMTLLCVQADADNKNLERTYQNKINKAIEELEKQNEAEYCKILVAIVPIQETEAWMLADKELLKMEIGTNKTDIELKINRLPESIANPKEAIEEAIRIARAGLSKKRRKELTISELYLPIGQSLELEKLERLDSYKDFQKNVREAFRKLNLLH